MPTWRRAGSTSRSTRRAVGRRGALRRERAAGAVQQTCRSRTPHCPGRRRSQPRAHPAGHAVAERPRGFSTPRRGVHGGDAVRGLGAVLRIGGLVVPAGGTVLRGRTAGRARRPGGPGTASPVRGARCACACAGLRTAADSTLRPGRPRHRGGTRLGQRVERLGEAAPFGIGHGRVVDGGLGTRPASRARTGHRWSPPSPESVSAGTTRRTPSRRRRPRRRGRRRSRCAPSAPPPR